MLMAATGVRYHPRPHPRAWFQWPSLNLPRHGWCPLDVIRLRGLVASAQQDHNHVAPARASTRSCNLAALFPAASPSFTARSTRMATARKWTASTAPRAGAIFTKTKGSGTGSTRPFSIMMSNERGDSILHSCCTDLPALVVNWHRTVGIHVVKYKMAESAEHPVPAELSG